MTVIQPSEWLAPWERRLSAVSNQWNKLYFYIQTFHNGLYLCWITTWISSACTLELEECDGLLTSSRLKNRMKAWQEKNNFKMSKTVYAEILYDSRWMMTRRIPVLLNWFLRENNRTESYLKKYTKKSSYQMWNGRMSSTKLGGKWLLFD